MIRVALALLWLSAVPASGMTPRSESSCAAGELRAAVVSFTRAFDRGAYEKLDSLFAPAPEFQWYSTPDPGRRMVTAARRRDSLIPYFRSRHAKRDNLHLTSFQFNGNSPHWGNFGFVMTHSASDFMGGRRFRQGGKGAAVCDPDGVRFIVFTFGTPSNLH